MKDSTTMTIIEFESFGGTFDQLHPKFEEMLKSVKLAYYKAVVRHNWWQTGKSSNHRKPWLHLMVKTSPFSIRITSRVKVPHGGLETGGIQGYWRSGRLYYQRDRDRRVEAKTILTAL